MIYDRLSSLMTNDMKLSNNPNYKGIKIVDTGLKYKNFVDLILNYYKEKQSIQVLSQMVRPCENGEIYIEVKLM